MSTIYVCDICKKEMKKRYFFVLGDDLLRDHFCKKCWYDPKKWPLIHKRPKTDD